MQIEPFLNAMRLGAGPAVQDRVAHQIVPNSARGRSFSVPVNSRNALTS
ncbi:hypothetical protein P3T22_004792 [Paraburkholderia sp. GAS348]